MARSVLVNLSERKFSTSEIRCAHHASFSTRRGGSFLQIAFVLLFSILLPLNLRALESGAPSTGKTPKLTSFVARAASQPAALTAPVAGSKLTGSSETFTWTAGSNVTAYRLYLGTKGTGSRNLYTSGATTATSTSVSGLPMTGVTIYAQLSSEIKGTWNSTNYTFTAGTSTPALSISAGSMAFGSVAVNSITTQSITLSSTGTAAVTINSASISGAGFSLATSTFPLTLTPGQSTTLAVHFDPTSAGVASGALTLASNASTGSSSSISLSGTGVPVLSAFNCSNSSMTGAGSNACTVTLNAAPASGGLTVSLASNNSSVVVPASVTVAAGATSAAFTATVSGVSAAQSTTLTAIAGSVSQSFALQLNAAVPTMSISSPSLNFGNVSVNSASSQTITLSSTGTANVIVNSATLTGAGFSISGATFPLTLSPNQSSTLTVQFDPSLAGAATGSLILSSNSSTGASSAISLAGSGVPVLNAVSCTSASLTGAANDTCSVALNAAAASSGFTVNLTSSNSAVVVPASISVVAGASNASFTATVSSVTTAQTAIVTANAGSTSQSFSLQLNAAVSTLTISTTALSFGSVPVNSTNAQIVTFTSTGSAPATINSATLTGAGFSISGATFPLTLDPNQSATLTVQFNPTTAGAATGTLVLSTDSSSGATASISLSGTGAPQAYQVALAWFAPASSNDPVATYNVYRSPSGSSSYQLMGSVSSSQLSFTDSSNVQSGQAYDYIVESVDADGNESAPSNMACVAIPGSGSGSSTCADTPVAPSLSALACVNASMTGSGTDTCTVTLSSAALSGGQVVSLDSSNSLVVVPASVTVPAGAASTSFAATVSPTTSADTAVLTATSANGTETFSVALDAYLPALTINATSIAFGDVNLNSSTTQYVTLTSSGTAPVTVNSASITGTGFTFAGAIFPLTLSANQTATFSVEFDPTAAGSVTGQLTISSDSSSHSIMAVALSGTGNSASYQIDLTWTAPPSSGDAVAGYNVYRAPSGSSSYQLVGSVNSDNLSYVDTNGVQGGQVYDYIVESVDASGNESVPSNTASVSVP